VTSAPYEIIVFVGSIVVVVEDKVATVVGKNADLERLQVYLSEILN